MAPASGSSVSRVTVNRCVLKAVTPENISAWIAGYVDAHCSVVARPWFSLTKRLVFAGAVGNRMAGDLATINNVL